MADREKITKLEEIRKKIKAELRKMLAESADPRSGNREERRIIAEVVPLLIGTFLVEEESGEIRHIADEFPSKEEHYLRNQNMPPECLPSSPEEAEKWGWNDGVGADCHQFTAPDKSNRKYVSPDSRLEVIFDSEGDAVTAPEDYGTYNLAAPDQDPVGHFYRDVLPWIVWGNEEADSTDMSMRLKAFVVDGGGNVLKKRVLPHGNLAADALTALSRSDVYGDRRDRKALSERLYPERLYRAVGKDDPEEVARILSEKGPLNQVRTANLILRMVDFENIYPLEKACETSFRMACMLLDAGADAGVVDPYIGSTPLIWALSENYEERFELALRLIEGGAQVDQVDDNGRCALNRAAVIYDSDSDAARMRELELVKVLFEKCDVEKVLQKCRGNPLIEAARFNNIRVMEYILDGGLIDINRTEDGYTALMKAVLANCEQAVELLLVRGADPEVVSPKGKTAKEYAIKKGNLRILGLFEDPSRC